MKKKLALLLAIVLVLGMVAACANDPAPAADAPPADAPADAPAADAPADAPAEAPADVPAGATVLTFWTFQQSHANFLEIMAESWNAENPDRQVYVDSSVFGFGDNHDNLLISLQAGTGAPDMADIEIGRFAVFLEGTPQLIPFNDLIEPIADQIIMSRMENYAKDGQFYGIDYHVGIPVIYYNTTLLEAAGINYMDIVTWDDFIEAGIQLREATGVPMTTLEVTEHWSMYPLMIQNGGDIFDGNGNVTLDSQENIDVLQMLYDMMFVHEIAVGAPGGFHHAEEWYGFFNGGGAASVWMPQWFMNRFTDFMPDLHGQIVMRPLPLFPNGSFGAGMGGTGTVVTNQTEHPELAAEFLVFAKLSEEGAIRTWTDLGFDPLRWDVWDRPEMREPNAFTEFFGDGVFDMLLEMRDGLTAVSLDGRFPASIGILQSQVAFNVFEARTMSPEDALRAAAEEIRSS